MQKKELGARVPSVGNKECIAAVLKCTLACIASVRFYGVRELTEGEMFLSHCPWHVFSEFHRTKSSAFHLAFIETIIRETGFSTKSKNLGRAALECIIQ